jgi:hypothetical protein
MIYPTKEELTDMSVWSLSEHVKELLAKELTEEQRRELAKIGKELARHEPV